MFWKDLNLFTEPEDEVHIETNGRFSVSSAVHQSWCFSSKSSLLVESVILN